MWLVPGATQRFIKNKSAGVRDKTLGLILHVQAGNGELTGWFNNPAAGASSCWQALKGNPNPIQFGDPDVDKFWTQAAGNADYGAVESEGYPNEPLDADQIEAIARIYAAGHLNEGWPFQLAEKPGDRGLGWHGMGGAAWGGHVNCPGEIRKAQRQQILDRAQQIAGVAPAPEKDDFDMTPAERKQLIDDIATAVVTKPVPRPGNYDVALGSQVGSANVQAYRILQLVKALNPASLAAAVAAGVKAAGASVDVDALAKAIVVELGKD